MREGARQSTLQVTASRAAVWIPLGGGGGREGRYTSPVITQNLTAGYTSWCCRGVCVSASRTQPKQPPNMINGTFSALADFPALLEAHEGLVRLSEGALDKPLILTWPLYSIICGIRTGSYE